MPDNQATIQTHSEYVTITTASWLINAFWSRTALTQTDQLHHDWSVITICSAKLCVCRRAMGKRCSTGQYALLPATWIWHKGIVVRQWHELNSTHRMHCWVSLQQWLRERANILYYKHTAYLVYLLNDVKEITRYVENTSLCPPVCAFVLTPELFVGFSWNSVLGFFMKSCQTSVSFAKIGSAAVMLYFGGFSRNSPYFPYISSDLDKIL